MRTNLPVTNREYVLQDAETVVSKTDLSGNITYVNADFVKISGFTEDELIGAPQNIVRHPDMPPTAFADFWETIRAGKAWTGMVKNRCKNGDHYWVEANAAPIIENGTMVGFTSIRVKPSRAQVSAAEESYGRMLAGDKSLTVREGVVVSSRSRRGVRLADIALTTQIWAFSLLNAVLVSGALAAAMAGMLALALGMAGAACLTGALFARLMIKGVVRPLRQVKRDIDQMSAGDLSGRIRAVGSREMVDMLQGLRVLQTNVKLLVGQIKEAAEVVTSGSANIAAGTGDLSQRTEAQASSLEETAASMEQLTATVAQNTERAEEANRLVGTAASIAIDGGKAVKQVVQTMASIRDSSARIVDIISVIDSIAFQTNILALNAAVEAARAGDQGRGFAVVAAEVRNLAQRSAGAAKEIKTLIGDSVQKVEGGSVMVEAAGATMAQIVSSVEQVAGFMNEIAVASQEQRAGIAQVNRAVSQMDAATQQNATIVDDSAQAAISMNQQAVKLTGLINSFQLVAMTGSVTRAATPATSAASRQRLQLRHG